VSDVIPNEDRGEHELTLAGVTYLLRPTYGAQKRIETVTGKSYAELVRAGAAGALHIGDAQVIAAEMIRDGASDPLVKRVSAERIGELIYEEGQPQVAARLTLAMLDALRGGRTASGEATAVAGVSAVITETATAG
jgi:hypothetical protein